jgi:predicted molibdopterin-dependent oxidoreductase YjgC
MLEAAVDGELTTLVLIGADPLADFPDAELASQALAACTTVIAVDLFANDSVAVSDIVLPAAGFAEVDGTHTNFEGRLSPLGQKVNAPGTARADWIIAADLGFELDADLGFDSVDAVFDDMVAVTPSHAGLAAAEVAAAPDGVVVSGPSAVTFTPPAATEIVPIDGYSLRLVTDHRLSDNGTIVQHCTSMANLGDVARVSLHPLDAAGLGVADGDTVKVTSAMGSLDIAVRPDGRVPRGSAVIPCNRPGADPRVLVDHDAVVTEVRVDTA